MSDNLDLSVSITTEEPEIAATLSDLRYLVFQGMKGDTGNSAYEEAVAHDFVGTEAEWLASLKGDKGDPGEDGVSFVSAYLDDGVVRYINDYREHDADDIYTATAMAQDINNGVLPLLYYSPEDNVFDYFELDRYDFSGATRVVYFRSKDYLLSVDSTGEYTLTGRPQGGGSAENAVLYTPQTLTPAQQAQARANIGASAGGDSGETLLGQTPIKLANPATIILRGNGETSFTAKSDTVAVFDPTAGTPNNATVTQTGGMFELSAGSGATAWYQSYVDVTIGGLTVGETYNLVFDGQGVPNDDSQHTGIGHYILYDGNGNTLVTRGATDGARLNSYAFTASTANVRLRWYPATNNTFSAGVSKAYANRIYINAANTTGYTPVVSLSGGFTGEKTLRSLPAGVTINATPSCAVYAVSDDEAQKPLAGKTVVVFGDSMIGMVRDDTSATAAIAERTGATVYNVGFGGCRMSDHPSHGYAEFSMWALAKAITDNDWSAQDAAAAQGSDYFPEQLAALKAIDFNTVDYAVIHYGTNDFGGGVTLGENSAASDHTTLCGALRYSIETLLGAYPKLRIFVSLPCFRFWTVDGQTVYSDTYQNAQSKTLPAYVEALRAVAREYKLPVVGNYYGNGIDKVNAATYLSDGTHHTALGRERFGNFIAEQLVSGGETYVDVPQMATQADMSDWTSGKTVDAAALKTGFQFALQQLDGKADTSDIPTAVSQLNNDSGYQTAQDVQTAIAAAAELPSGGQNGQALVSNGQSGAVWGVKPFALPSGGQSGEALLSDGNNGAYWGTVQSGGVQTVTSASQMTDTDTLYKYLGNETGYIRYAVYGYDGAAWSPFVYRGSVKQETTDIYSSSLFVDNVILNYSSSDAVTKTSAGTKSIIVPLKNGSSYVINKGSLPRFRVSVFDHYPEADGDRPVTILKLNDAIAPTTLSYECQNDGYYLMIYGCNDGQIHACEILETSLVASDDDYFTTDKTLTKAGIPADAKVVGDNINAILVEESSDLYVPSLYVDNVILGYLNGAHTETYNGAKSLVVPLVNGCSYVINKGNLPRFRASVFDHLPTANNDIPVTVLKLDDSGSVSTLNYDCQNDGYYLMIYGSNDGQIYSCEIIQTGKFINPAKLPESSHRYLQETTFNEFKDELLSSAVLAHVVPAVANADAVARFVTEMNRKAAKIGMTNSVFADPAGHDVATTRTTARDMVKMGIAALSYNELCRVWGKQSYTVTTLGESPRNIALDYGNATALTGSYMTLGKKEGYMPISGSDDTYTMVAVCVVDGKIVVGAIGGATSRANRPVAMKELMDNVAAVMSDGTATTPTYYKQGCAAVLLPVNTATLEQQNIDYIYTYNADVSVVPASVTKVLTSMVMLDNIGNIHDKMTVLSTDGLDNGSGQVLIAGDVINYEQALYLMMIVSSGPCCRVVARTLGQVMLSAYD